MLGIATDFGIFLQPNYIILMNSYYFTEEHETFRSGLKQFLDKEVKPNIDEWEEKGQIPKAIWKKFGDMGYLGLNYPEQYGGSSVDFWYTVVFMEEISKMHSGGFSITAAVQQYMSSPYINKYGSDFLKEKYLKPAISGELICSIGISEPGAGSDVANIQTKAIREGDYYIVNGAKTFITNGFYGDFVVAVVKTNPEAGTGGVSLLVIDLDSPGISRRKLKKLGWHSSDTAELNFDDVKVPIANRIGEEGQGFYYLMGGLQLERLVGSIMGYSSCENILEYSVKYMGERKAFGRTIDKFQVLRHRVAQLATEIEACKQFVYYVCRLHADGKFAVKECSMTKLLATELADKVMYQCVQFFGGYGYMEEYKVARGFRDARIGTIGGGTSEIMREIIAKMVIDDVNYNTPNLHSETNNSAKQQVVVQDPKPTTAKGILLGLSSRLKAEKAANFSGNFHFDISGPNGGKFTVMLQNGTCEVSEGLFGEPKCITEVEDEVYLAVETGKMNPQEALMTGKLKVSNIMEMMQFGGLFRRLN